MTVPIVRIDRLSKNFGAIAALREVSLDVYQGDILGILGPNGAGKSTLIRILTGYIPASAGRVTVNGLDVSRHSLAVRSRIGYLPENTPLYNDMRVNEFLKYRAALKGVKRRRRRGRLDDVLELCQIGDVRRQIVGTLSKGYRQRVGLADALIHNPPILVLDEPTVGLDPVQVRTMRNLLRELAEHHTILFSSHILTEVEAVCKRIAIVNRGRLVSQEVLAEGRKVGRLRVEMTDEPAGLRTTLTEIVGVRQVQGTTREGVTTLWVEHESNVDPRATVAQAVNRSGATLRELSPDRTTLEDRFMEAVGG
jgi:ABC-2 type transport system ATP-binding protein